MSFSRAASVLTALLALSGLHADEGMWTFDNLPLAKIQAKYGFAPDAKWLEHVRLASLNFGGASGSFISKDGLVVTNHHVGRGWVQSVSGPGAKDYIKLGFLAKTRAEEIKIPGLVIRTLMAMENVSDKVQAAVKPGMDAKAATEARQLAFEALRTDLEKRSTGLEVRAVTLYQGGEYWLYTSKAHKDVRLVMAPEMQAAMFGGDFDNFTYPRHSLDMTFFRVYENDKPYQPLHHLAWASSPLNAGDLTFVVGHPGRTQRQETFAQMKYQRDVGFPVRIATSEARKKALYEYGKQSAEHERQVRTAITNVENGLKATYGYWAGLKDAEAFAELERKEQELRAKVAKDSKLQAEAGQSWAKIEEALKQQKPLAKDASLLNTRGSVQLMRALSLVRLIEESAKPAAQRMKGYQKDEDLAKAKASLERPVRVSENPAMDTFLLVRNLEELKAELAPEHPFRKALLDGKEPAEVAKSLLEGTKMADPALVKQLIEGGVSALAACSDPAVVAARKISPLLVALNAKLEAIQVVISEHAGRIAKARFAVYGKSLYPDATGTLRLSFGPVAGVPGLGTQIQPFTTFHGLFDRALGWGPTVENGAWAMGPRWNERKATLNLETPFNFSHKVDIIGGNSGSPVVNTKAEFVGVIFDGNITMLPGNFYYDEKVNRGGRSIPRRRNPRQVKDLP